MKAVIFDMDGVIIDSEEIYYAIENGMFDRLGISVSEVEHRSLVGVALMEAWAMLKIKYSLGQTVEELVEWERKLYSDHIDTYGIHTVPGVIKLVHNIHGRGVSLAIASSSGEAEIYDALDKTGLEGYFKTIVSGEHVTSGKPSPDIYLLAAEKLEVRPCDCVAIEDSSKGARSAKSAGMACLGYVSAGSGSQDLADADRITHDLKCISCDYLLDMWRCFSNGQC